MRQVKCDRCGKLTDRDKLHRVEYINSKGNLSKKKFCNKECYEEGQREVYYLKQCQYFVDEIFGYVVVNNQKNKEIQGITAAGYTREELYDCMVELKDKILEGLNYRQDIEEEVNRIRYMFAIVKGNIKQITDRNKKLKDNKENNSNQDEVDIVEEDVCIPKIKKQSKNTLMDIIKGGA